MSEMFIFFFKCSGDHRNLPSCPTRRSSALEGEPIAKVIAPAGVGSRRDAEAMIAEGRVTLNGAVLSSPAVNVTDADRIAVDRKSTRLNSSHANISYAVFCL